MLQNDSYYDGVEQKGGRRRGERKKDGSVNQVGGCGGGEHLAREPASLGTALAHKSRQCGWGPLGTAKT